MLMKLLKKLLGFSSKSHQYRKYSSSDYANRKNFGRGHNHYGRSHYKKKHSSHSFFSS